MFDWKAFHLQLSEAYSQSKKFRESESHLEREIAFQRDDGIRTVIETRERQTAQQVHQNLTTEFPDIAWQLTRLFPGAEEEDRLSESLDLARFWLLKIPGLSIRELGQNPYDLAYLLRDQLDLASADPDIPFTENNDDENPPPAEIVGTCAMDRAWSLRAMRVPEAWEFSERKGQPPQGRGILIGHPDTGWTEHNDLDFGRLAKAIGWNFIDGNGNAIDPLDYRGNPSHGTATGSVIMSGGTVEHPPTFGEGGTGAPGKVTGVAPQSTLVPIRTVRKVWWVFSSHLAQAIFHARMKGCHVVSISLGGRGFRHLRAALLDAVKHNVIVVAAAGNYFPLVVYPARYPACIALAATNCDHSPWIGSTCGPEVAISAPGENVWRAYRTGLISHDCLAGPSSGTSYATANTAGVAVLWLAHYGRNELINMANGIPLQDLFRAALTESARRVSGLDKDLFGAGIVDARCLLEISITSPHVPQKLTAGRSQCLADLHQRQRNIDLAQAHNLISDQDIDLGNQVLTRLINADIDHLSDMFEHFGPEIVNILFDLKMARHSVLRKETLDRNMAQFVDSLRREICQRASVQLRKYLQCPHPE